ncbi:uncharacterized protein LOC108865222 [Galendromus occidentalis]|uniref:Uncharacterized protein LOC108865222 n=1 Tax=Galendromus occidentalis TaxID=34638 RepID=A0AAJ7L8R0_9ACAR|nr:uncharacterized protein LOC108865222 [Galendromus occidentalis]
MTATLLESNVSKSRLYRWRIEEEKLSTTDRRRRAFRKGKAKLSAPEPEIKQWVLERSSLNRALQVRDVQRKALERAKNAGIENFKASNGWVHMKRNNRSVRRPTGVGQPLPNGAVEKIAAFREFVMDATSGLTPSSVGNMDEVPKPFDITYGRTQLFQEP